MPVTVQSSKKSIMSTARLMGSQNNDSDGTVVPSIGTMSQGKKVGEWLYYLKSDGGKTTSQRMRHL